jgi:hypothetical protein
MQCCSVLIVMQSSSPTLSTPSTVNVSIFSCEDIKKSNSNICTALLATDKSVEQNTIHNKQQTIHQQMHQKKKNTLTLK